MSTKATVGPKGASVLEQADSNSARVLQLGPGARVDILGEEGDYYRIPIYGTNRDFFIAKESVETPDDYGHGKAGRTSRARTKRSPGEATSKTPPSYRRRPSVQNPALSASSVGKLHDPFLSNPFRILGLAAGVSSQDIRKRADDLRIDARLSSGSDSGLRVEALTRAHADLLDPAKRIIFEALWFYDPPVSLFDGQVPAGDAEFERYRGGGESSSDKGIESRHDIAVWLLLQATHTEDLHAAQNLTTRALSSLSELLDDPEYRKYTGRFGVKASERTRHLIWQEAISALAAAAQRSAERGANEQVAAYYRGARAHGVEADDERNLLGPAIQVVVFSVARVVDAAEKGVPAEGSAVSLFDEWAAQMDRDLGQAVRLCRELGETAFPELASQLDAAASLLRSEAIDLHNKRNETECTIRLLGMALNIVASEYVRDRLETDRRTLFFQWHMGRCVALVRQKRWSEADAEARIALDAATTPEERRAAGDAVAALTARTSGAGGLGPLAGWVARVAVLALIGAGIFAARGGFSSDSSPASSPASYPAQQKPVSSGVSAEKQRLETQIEDNNLQLAFLESQLTSLKNKMDAIEAQYPSRVLPPTVYDDYESTRLHYNSLVDQYQTLVDETNSLIDRYNSLR